jgi:hypothetical protein
VLEGRAAKDVQRLRSARAGHVRDRPGHFLEERCDEPPLGRLRMFRFGSRKGCGTISKRRMEKRYEFETRRWSRVRNDERLADCVVVSVRKGWQVMAYECRLYICNQLCYSRPFSTRRLAEADADSLLGEIILPVSSRPR